MSQQEGRPGTSAAHYSQEQIIALFQTILETELPYPILTMFIFIPGVTAAFSLFLLPFFISFIIAELQLSRIVYFFMSP